MRAAVIVRALHAAGHPHRAETLCTALDLARTPVLGPVTRETWEDALEREAVTDGEEDVPQLFIRDAASFATWEKRAVAHLAAVKHALAVGRALFGKVGA